MGFFLREIYYHDSLVMGTINLQKKHIVFPGLVLDQLDHLGRPVPWLGRAHLQLPNRSLPFYPHQLFFVLGHHLIRSLKMPFKFHGA